MLKKFLFVAAITLGFSMTAQNADAFGRWIHHRHHCHGCGAAQRCGHASPTIHRRRTARYRAPISVGTGIGSPYRGLYGSPYRGYGIGGYPGGLNRPRGFGPAGVGYRGLGIGW